MMRKLKCLLNIVSGIVILTVCLTGCDNRRIPDESQLVVEKDYSLKSYLIEPFDREYYDFADFKEWINKEVSLFNNSSADDSYVQLLQVLKIEESDMVAVTLKYSDYNAYSSFYDEPFFCGRVSDSFSRDVAIPETLNDADSGDKITKSAISDLGDYNLLVWTGDTRVILPEKIQYCSSNVEVISGKKAAGIDKENEQGEEIFYLLYK